MEDGTAHMGVMLKPVTTLNRGDLDDIDAGSQQRYWVHANWYWHQQSLDNSNILFRLIHIPDVEGAVGMVAFGPAYADERLTQIIDGAYELIHLVIDVSHQRRGIGRTVTRAVLHMLAAQPDCTRVLVAHNPENSASHIFFTSLGFRAIDRQNYDGDPMLELSRHAALQLILDEPP